MRNYKKFIGQRIVLWVGLILWSLASTLSATATEAIPHPHHGGEANLILPRLDDTTLASFGGLSGHGLLLGGLLICLLGLGFGLIVFAQMRRRPVHRAMLEISELIYETCKTYLITQGKFLTILWLLIGVIIVAYFGFIQHMEAYRVGIILAFSVLGIAAGFYETFRFIIRMSKDS